jgi:hypothetical protein
MAELSITCPKCNRTSHHPEDANHGYCGACHEYTTERDARTITVKVSKMELEDLRSACFYFFKHLEGQESHTYKDNFRRLFVDMGGKL